MVEKNQKKIVWLAVLVVVIVGLAILLLMSNILKDGIKTSDTAKWGNVVSIEAKEVLSIGSDTIDDLNHYFGPIGDIIVDNQGCIFILDPDNHRVQKFSKTGQFLQSYGGARGEGPGEFLKPGQMAIDTQNRLYVTDADLHRVTVFSPGGDLVKTIQTVVRPYDIAVGKNFQIYMTGMSDTAEDRVSQYDYNSGGLVRKFGKKRKENDFTARAGGADTLCLDSQGSVYLCFCYPYEIRKFSPEGELLNRFTREVKFLKKPSAPLGPVILYTSVSGIHHLPDGKLMTVIWHINNYTKKDWFFLFDVFNERGEWLFSFPSSELGIDFYRTMAVDNEGYVYYDNYDPFPHAKKYSFKYAKKI